MAELILVGLLLIGGAWVSYQKRWLTAGGAAGMAVLGAAIDWAFGLSGLLIIFLFFVAANLISAGGGRPAETRTVVQVFANGGAAARCVRELSHWRAVLVGRLYNGGGQRLRRHVGIGNRGEVRRTAISCRFAPARRPRFVRGGDFKREHRWALRGRAHRLFRRLPLASRSPRAFLCGRHGFHRRRLARPLAGYAAGGFLASPLSMPCLRCFNG